MWSSEAESSKCSGDGWDPCASKVKGSRGAPRPPGPASETRGTRRGIGEEARGRSPRARVEQAPGLQTPAPGPGTDPSARPSHGVGVGRAVRAPQPSRCQSFASGMTSSGRSHHPGSPPRG
ncbi:protein bassoon-like [Eschrichtius robustus]|uniref:protein bassoon-like n=1 Tax=Eschrichtius robustus TaxID=9764 RepID=UPI0035C1C4B1